MKVKEYKSRARKALSGKYGLVIGAALVSGLMTLIPVIPALLCFLCGVGFAAYRSYGMTGSAGLYRLGSHTYPVPDGVILGSTALFAILTALCIFLILILAFLMGIGIQRLYLNICRGSVYRFGDLFYAFRRGSRPLRIFGAGVLSILILLLLFGIYGIGMILAAVFAPRSAGVIIVWAVIWFILYLYICFGISLATLVLIDRPQTRIGQAFSESMRLMKGRRFKFFWMSLSFLFWNIPLWLTGGLAALWIKPYISCTGMFFYLDAAGEIPIGTPEMATETETEVPLDEAGSGVVQGEIIPVSAVRSDEADRNVPETPESSVQETETTIEKAIETDPETRQTDHE